MKTKTLLYCTKAKPYLVQGLAKPMHTLAANNPYNFNWKVVKKGFSNDRLNGKIVAECDFEVEEHNETTNDWLCMSLREKILFGNLCKKASIDELECYKYANGKPLYAIHIKNLHTFDNPLELKDTYARECMWDKCSRCEYGKNGKINCCTIDIPLSRAPQNMMWVWYKGERYVLISIQPKWLCKILNGEKTIECRKRILKEMMSK